MSIDASLIGYEAAKTAIARSRAQHSAGVALTGWQSDPVGWVETRLGEHLWSRQRDIALSVRDNRRTVVASSYDTGKCLAWDESVLLADGRVARAGDLVGRCFSVVAWQEDGQQIPVLAWGSDNGVEPLWRVTTTSGRTLVRTAGHPLYAASRTAGGPGKPIVVTVEGWTPVGDLSVGHLVLVPERIPGLGHRPKNPDEVKFLGYMLGDGGTTRGVAFTQEEGPAKDEFRDIVGRFGCQCRESPKNRLGIVVSGPPAERFGRKATNLLLNRLRDWGLYGVKSKAKRFPAWAWELPDEQLALLLNRLFACDGWAYGFQQTAQDRHGRRGNVQIGIASASVGLIRDVELAMTRLGINGRVRARQTALADKIFASWEWCIVRLADMERFRTVVGIFGKEAAVDHAIEIKRSFAARIARPATWMRQRAPVGYRWERVREIEPLGDGPTVAITVPSTGTFLSTFVEHNSWVAARLACWWLESHTPGEAFVVSTAGSWPQVRAILWREINRAHAKGKLSGSVNQTEWWLGGEMVAMGRKPAEYNAQGFAGIHARYVLVVIDEASDVPASLWTAADGLIANEDSRILAIGNPVDAASQFASVSKPGSGWNAIAISAFDSPNFTGEAVEPSVAAQLVSRTWVDEKRQDWTESSPLWQSLVLGQFPEESTDSVVLLSWARKCQQDPDTDEQARQWSQEEPNELGVDVGAGGDETVIYHRKGARASMIWHGQTPDWPQATGQVVDAIRQTGATSVKVDVIGIGWGVVGRLQELRDQGAHHCEVIGVNVAEAPSDPSRFVKLRDEIWWTVGRDLSRALAWDLRGVDDATIGQLIAPKYGQDSAGRIKVEKKEETRKRIGRSPDRADALLLAFYSPAGIRVEDIDAAYGIIRCAKCGHGYIWQPERPCPKCWTKAPAEYPK